MSLGRRTLLGTAAVAALASTACQRGGVSTPSSPASTPVVSQSRPPKGDERTVELWVDDSRRPAAWADELAALAAEQTRPLKVQVNSTSQLAASLGDRIRAQEPPAVILDAGPDLLGLGALAPRLAPLDKVLDARTPDGAVLRAVLRPGTVAAGTLQGKLLALPRTLTVHGLWYSARRFQEAKLSAPRTWEDLLGLGETARKQNKHLFCWGREGATNYLRLCLSSAIKQGGDEVRLALESLDPKAWTMPPVQASLTAMHTAVSAGMVKPGGSQRSWRSALAAWSRDGSVLMVAAGSWLAGEVEDEEFGLTLVPDPSVDSKAAMPAHALHAGPEENFVTPADSGVVPAARELVAMAFDRALLTAFTQEHRVLTTRLDALPTTPDPVLTRQAHLLEAAGKDVFSWRFIDHLGANHDHQALWNAFLEGRMDVSTLTRESQRIGTLLAQDPTIVRATRS